MELSIIVAASENNVIGHDNTLIWHLPADLKYFKGMTTGNTIIMGRKTYDSIGRPLPNRRNIVISRNPEFEAPGIEVAPSIDEALKLASSDEKVFIIGGGTIYNLLWNVADKLFLTRVHAEFKGDITIPAVSESDWKEVKCEDHQADEKNAYDYSFIEYHRR